MHRIRFKYDEGDVIFVTDASGTAQATHIVAFDAETVALNAFARFWLTGWLIPAMCR
jgi:hypothetical protein